jgi:hypothetical protein
VGRISQVMIENRKLPFPSPSANLVGFWEDKEEMIILLAAILRQSLRFTNGESENSVIHYSQVVFNKSVINPNIYRLAASVVDKYFYCLKMSL